MNGERHSIGYAVIDAYDFDEASSNFHLVTWRDNVDHGFVE